MGGNISSPNKRFDGQKGFEDRKRKDEIKNNYCKENNIPLIRISYLEFNYENNNIRNILNEKLMPL